VLHRAVTHFQWSGREEITGANVLVAPPVPPEAQAAVQAKGQQRYEGFLETLGQRLQKGQSFLIPQDVEKKPSRGRS
jgi:hypothetical protein